MREKTATILLAEDNPADVFLVRRALQLHNVTVSLHVVADGDTAMSFIEAAELNDELPCPVLALLDLNLPKRSGLEVLARIRRSGRCGNIPVAVISSSRSPADATSINQLRADHFFTKPSDYDQFMMLGGIVKELLNREKT